MRVTFKPIPRFYELSWDSPNRELHVLIHHRVLSKLFSKPQPQTWPIVQHYQKTLNVEFTADPEVGFGFSPHRFMRRGTKGDFVVFVRQLPQIEVEAGVCPECKGDDEECFYCNHRGKVFEYRHERGKLTSLGLSLILSRCLMEDSIRLPGTHHQLATIELSVADRTLHAYPLWGSFSPEMIKWLVSRGQTDLTSVRTAMMEAYTRMCPSWNFPGEFRAWLDGGRFHMSVPGNCACLGVPCGEHSNIQDGLGYSFSTHNVDVSIQQLSLLAGVSTLWQEARKVIYQEN